MVAASKAGGLKVPLVVRMKGTNEDLGKEILAKSGLPIITANNMGEAAEKVVAAAKAYNPGVTVAGAAVAGAAALAGAAKAAAPSVAATTTAATAAAKPLQPSEPASGWMKWLALIVAAILAALLLKQCGAAKDAPKVAEAPKAAEAPKVVEAPKAVLPSFGKWAATAAGDKLTLCLLYTSRCV